MRRLAVILVLAGMALPALGARRVTVEELAQAVAALHQKRDADAAWQIAEMRLSERLSTTRAKHIEKDLPGEKSRQALEALADESQFLDPPAAEIPAKATPDFAEQRQMMGLVVAYVARTIPLLPNFFATRMTTRFEDVPQLQTSTGFDPYEPLHKVGVSKETVLYRGGHEVVDTGTAKKPKVVDEGLNTMGVFGPILGTVLLDAARSKLAWGRWEQRAGGLQAVFKFQVPKEKSHYEVDFCCVAHQTATAVANVQPFRQVMGYHGEMAVDPATGTILRLAVEADLKPTDPVVQADILVEYGPVEIGGKTYFCPVKSISIAHAETIQVDAVYKFPLANQLQPLQTALNDVAFENYHMFRANVRMLSPEEARLAGVPAAPEAADANAVAPEDATAAAPEDSTLAAPEATPRNDAGAASTWAPAAAENAAPAVAAAPAAGGAAAAEITVMALNGLPEMPANAEFPAPGGGFTLRATSRLVDVDVVAYDAKGQPVRDLKAGDFELLDEGVKEPIRFFSEAGETGGGGVSAGPATGAVGEAVFSNRPESGGRGVSGAESNLTILMIDAGNLAWGDLTYARAEMLRFLKTLGDGERVGFYAMTGQGFEIEAEPTTDHAQLAATLSKWMPSAQDLARAQEEERRNRQHFDWVHSVSDLANVNGNGEGGNDPEMYAAGTGKAYASSGLELPPDAKLMAMGSAPERDALFLLQGVARHLAALPGHKTLVWVSSDNVLADWSSQAAAKQDQGSKFLNALSMDAQEALNEGHVSIYPLDASQLEAGGIAADIGTRNVLVVGKSDRDKSLAGMNDAFPGMKPGRETAQMQQDTHAIQPTFRELAEATGGRALRRAGDIAAELNGIVEEGRASYLLSFTPDTPPDDMYHRLTVKVIGRPDVKLRYRTGYLYEREAATLKERIRKATWQATDVSDIAITATAEKDSKGGLLRLNIAGSDLDLAQQDGRWVDRVDVFLVKRSEDGLHAEVSGQAVRLRLEPATHEKILREGLPFDERVESKMQVGSLRVMVMDEGSGRMGTLTLPATALGHGQ